MCYSFFILDIEFWRTFRSDKINSIFENISKEIKFRNGKEGKKMPSESKKTSKEASKKTSKKASKGPPNKTMPTPASVDEFIQQVDDTQKREDSYKIIEWMKEITGENPVMWGPSIIGFGTYHYKYATGREGDMPIAGFSPRKQNMTIYFMPGFAAYQENLDKLGKYKLGKGCLYINHLKDVDAEVLKTMIADSVKKLTKNA